MKRKAVKLYVREGFVKDRQGNVFPSFVEGDADVLEVLKEVDKLLEEHGLEIWYGDATQSGHCDFGIFKR